jgi:hypothetical protein
MSSPFGTSVPLYTDRTYDIAYTPGEDLTGVDVERYLVDSDGTRTQWGETKEGTDQTQISFTDRLQDLGLSAGRYTLLTQVVDQGTEETLKEEQIQFTTPSDE